MDSPILVQNKLLAFVFYQNKQIIRCEWTSDPQVPEKPSIHTSGFGVSNNVGNIWTFVKCKGYMSALSSLCKKSKEMDAYSRVSPTKFNGDKNVH